VILRLEVDTIVGMNGGQKRELFLKLFISRLKRVFLLAKENVPVFESPINEAQILRTTSIWKICSVKRQILDLGVEIEAVECARKVRERPLVSKRHPFQEKMYI
jgi:hypothetical protein